jgi:prepilin-type processing-associated H-X9-DG protein
MKQLGDGFMMYVDDWHGAFPGTGPSHRSSQDLPFEWVRTVALGRSLDVTAGSLWRYVRNRGAYVCPSDKNARNQSLQYACSYGMNSSLDPDYNMYNIGSWRPVLLSQVNSPIRTVLLGDKASGAPGDVNLDKIDPPIAAHLGWADIAFCDGHVQGVRKERILKLQYNPY